MKEESQIEHMRAAIRGDRERAEQARQRSTENVLSLPQTPEAVSEPLAEQLPGPGRGRLRRLLSR